jgi:hypothetical protein
MVAHACARRRELRGNRRMEWVTQLLKRDGQVITCPALLPTIKTYDLLPSFLAGIKTNWPVDTYLLRIIQVATKRSELFAFAELTELTPPPIRMDWSLTLKDKI